MIQTASPFFRKICPCRGRALYCHSLLIDRLHSTAYEHAHLKLLNDSGLQVDEATYAKLLRLSGSARDLFLGQMLHLHIISSSQGPSLLVGNLLIQMYGKCGALDDALAVFSSMRVWNEFSWTLIIASFVQQEHFEKAAQLFEDMGKSSIVPDIVTFIVMVSACADEEDLDTGMRLHCGLVEGEHDTEVVIANALLNMYGNCCCLPDARKVFMSIETLTLVSWNTMIGIYSRCEQVEAALQLFQQMQVEGLLPDKYSYVSIINVSRVGENLAQSKHIHSLLVQGVFKLDMIVVTALLKMYSSLGVLLESQMLFEGMQIRDLIAWNAMISVYYQHAHGDRVFGLSQQMQTEGLMPDNVTFAALLSACADLQALYVGKHVHACIMYVDSNVDVSLGNSLITMYGKCNDINHAEKVFHRMPDRDVISWNTLITSYNQLGHRPSKLPFMILQQMLSEGLLPNKVTIVGLFDMCHSQAHEAECRLLHSFILGSDLELDGSVGTAVVSAFGKCGNLWEAQKMFYKMVERNEFAWNAIIAAHAHHGIGRGAIQLYKQIEMEGMLANKVTVLTIIDTCANDANLAEGKRVHVQALSICVDADVAIATALSDMYGKCGFAEDAWSSFNVMATRDIVSWNALEKAYSQHGLGIEALELFEQIRQDVVPNLTTLTSVLLACSHAGLVHEGCYCFLYLTEEHAMKPMLKQFNIVMDLLGRAGLLEETEILLCRMPCQPSAASWFTLLDACRKYWDAKRGSSAAKHLFELHCTNPASHIMMSGIHIMSNLEAATEVKPFACTEQQVGELLERKK